MDALQQTLSDTLESGVPDELEVGDETEGACASFASVYRQHREEVMCLLRRRLGNEEDAADLTQEAFLRVLRYRDCSAQALKFLVLRVALNLAVSHARRAYIRCDVSLDGFDLADERAAPDDQLMREQLLQQVTDAIGRLPPRCREMFLLSRIHGLRQREIARRCGVSSRAVEKQMTHARCLLRAQLCEAVA